MDDKTLKAYNAINGFVTALYEQFGKHNKPLALYNRLLEKTSLRNIESIKKHITVFENFFKTYKTYILKTNFSLPQNAVIKFSERVFIDIGVLIKKSDKDTLDAIQQHLLTIMNIISPDKRSLQALDNIMATSIDTSTNEGEFINDIMNNIRDTVEDGGNPMAALPSLVGKMFTGLEKGTKSGELDIVKLFGSMQGMINNIMKEASDISQEVQEEATPSPLRSRKAVVEQTVLTITEDEKPKEENQEESKKEVQDEPQEENQEDEPQEDEIEDIDDSDDDAVNIDDELNKLLEDEV